MDAAMSKLPLMILVACSFRVFGKGISVNTHTRWGIILAVLGVVSFAVSILVSRLDYRAQEASGAVGDTPTWIVVWHVVSLGIAQLGGGMSLMGCLRRTRQEDPPLTAPSF